MLLDTGAQISLINNNIIPNKLSINRNNKILISSLHGSEDTLGNIQAVINQDNNDIPLELQVTKDLCLREDGILGYDFIGERAVIDGPNKTLYLTSGDTSIKFPIKKSNTIQQEDIDTIQEEIRKIYQINYITEEEEDIQYKINRQRVKTITHEINSTKIRIGHGQ